MSEIGDTFKDLKELRTAHRACKPRCVECGSQLGIARFAEGRELCGSCTLRETIRKQEKALRNLVEQCLTTLKCDDFHHARKDQHGVEEECEPCCRYYKALYEASELLG